MKIGLLTGGGDCPGLNAVIRAVVRKGSFHYEDEFVGFMEGWRIWSRRATILVLEKGLEAIRCQLGIARRVTDVLVTHVLLDRPRILALVREVEAERMA